MLNYFSPVLHFIKKPVKKKTASQNISSLKQKTKMKNTNLGVLLKRLWGLRSPLIVTNLVQFM